MTSADGGSSAEEYWDIWRTRLLIEQRHGHDQLELARHSIRSVTERMNHARYHYQEARSILRDAIDARLEDGSAYQIVLPAPDWVGGNDLTFPLMKAEANLIAAALSIHSIGDILAHVVYFALAINCQFGAPQGRKVSLGTVRSFLKQAAQFPEVRALLDRAASLPELRPVAKIANYTKHHAFVESVLSFEPEGRSEPYAFEFGRFPGVEKCDREIEAILGPAFERTSEIVVRTGISINEVLSQ